MSIKSSTKNKKLKTLLATSAIVLSIGALVPIIYFWVKPSNQSTELNTSVFGRFKEDFSKLSDEKSKLANEFYGKNTTSIFVSRTGASSGSAGTIWNWPKPQSDTSKNYYFATNIHVIKSTIQYDSNSNQYSLKSDSKFMYSQDGQNVFSINNVSIHKIIASNSIDGIDFAISKFWYQDLVILKTTTNIFNSLNSLNFMDTSSEFNWLTNKISNNPTDLDFFISGYPATKQNTTWPNVVTKTSIKYKYENDRDIESYGLAPKFSDAASILPNYLDSNYGLEFGNKLHKNYAYQLLLPNLGIGGGSSGSLVSVWYNNSLMPIGIYWGVYTYNFKDIALDMSGIDLFYVNKEYSYNRGKITMPTYNNSPLN
ncbi:MAG: hypothetical protein ACRC4M_01670 [Mycoplasma sp.]